MTHIKIKKLIPFLLLFFLFGLFWRELFYSRPHELPSARIGETVPDFHLPILNNPQQFFSSQHLPVGQVVLLNVWATWCYACMLEHAMLMKINNTYHIPIYSIDYKDNAEEAQQWLQKNGNPYALIGSDKNGDAAIDLGVYGTPETFVISRQGKIVYRHVGEITENDWTNTLYPLIQKYESAQ